MPMPLTLKDLPVDNGEIVTTQKLNKWKLGKTKDEKKGNGS